MAYPIIRETSRRLTYLGRRAVVLTIHHDSKRTGLRTIETTWIDDADPRNGGWKAGDIVRTVVRGDGQTDDFEVIEPATRIGRQAL